MKYDPSSSSVTPHYVVAATGDPLFIPGNCQAPTNSPDNPDNGTKAERLASNLQTSPNGEELLAS